MELSRLLLIERIFHSFKLVLQVLSPELGGASIYKLCLPVHGGEPGNQIKLCIGALRLNRVAFLCIPELTSLSIQNVGSLHVAADHLHQNFTILTSNLMQNIFL